MRAFLERRWIAPGLAFLAAGLAFAATYSSSVSGITDGDTISINPGVTTTKLSWSGSYGATSYNIKRGLVSGGEATVRTGWTSTSFTDTGLASGTTYYYVVTAVNSFGEGPPSNEASARAK